ncbi:MAG: cysteine desulfurase family protein [bacterium]|nr:cysteine desulfurase family protein [bacterium]
MTSTTAYFDHGATSPLRNSAYEAMKPYMMEKFANPASAHRMGLEARHALDSARDRIADILGVDSREIIFTSGGTEGIILSLVGAYIGNKHRGRHILVSSIEHSATLTILDFLKNEMGAEVETVDVDRDGILQLDDFERKLRDDTVLVSVMRVNNEIGTIQPIERISEICKLENIIVQSDCVQSFGKILTDLKKLDVDIAIASSHKFGGPRGSGFMYVRQGTYIKNICESSHEFGLRAGTVNVAGAVGTSVALVEAIVELPGLIPRLADFRRQLLYCINNTASDASINGSSDHCIPSTLNVHLPGCEGEVLVQALDMDGIEAGAGSACHSGANEPSHVLTAMGRSRLEALSNLRLSMGYTTIQEEVDRFIKVFPGVYGRVRGTDK